MHLEDPAAPAFTLESSDGGKVKLSAAWLIEAAGFSKGYARGNARISANVIAGG